MTLFVDMDGVLANFDAHYLATFNTPASKLIDNVDWKAVDAKGDFFLNIPPMPDLDHLWRFIEPLRPIVLTGVPKTVKAAVSNKRAWAKKHLGDHIEVRCCKSKEKCLHAEPGDILIDDWEKYRHLWLGAGGRWITHTSAADTIERLREIL